jgi:pre-rRNA-processing protein TSR2
MATPNVTVVAPAAAPESAADVVKRMMQRARATPEQLAVFFRGLDAVLMQWTALNLVAAHSDATSTQELRDELREWFEEDGEVFSDELEENFEDFFVSSRFAAIEDGSPKEVADTLHEMYVRCCRNDDSTVLQFCGSLAAYQASTIAQCQFDGVAEGRPSGDAEGDAEADEADEDAEVEEVAPPQPKAPKQKFGNKKGADGWSTVTRKK